MNRVKSESESSMQSKDNMDSALADEGSSGGPVVGGGILKKGPWTSSEDAILGDYVKKHGEGNWNAVQKYSGLSRCGKSCRLRWANHLRPNLKKGAISPDEERMIIELHARMGNKWARMTASLPGRTDNEIKNYWNTRIKRRQRAGLPLYPPEMPFEPNNENLQTLGASDFSSLDNQHNETLQGSGYDFPDVIFEDYKVDRETLSHLTPYSELPSILSQGFGSKNCVFMNPACNQLKRFRESESFFAGFDSNLSIGLPTFDQFSQGPSEKIRRFACLYGPDPSNKNLAPSGGVIPGSHALSNGMFSTFSPPGIAKLELPSLQYSDTENGTSNCPASPSMPPLAIDTYIQPPPETVSPESDNVPPRNSGLLEAMFHEPGAISNTKNHQPENISTSSVLTPNYMMGSTTLNFCGTRWSEYSDPNSPLGLNVTSVFCDTSPISASSIEDFQPSIEHSDISTPIGELDDSSQPDLSRPDVLLGSNLFVESSRGAKERSMLNDALATLRGDNIHGEHKFMSSGSSSSSNAQGLGLESYPWDNMPRVYQMAENP